MALGIQDLMAAAQRAGIDPGQAMKALGGMGGGAPGGGMPQAPGGGGDLGSQLMGLVGKVASSPGGAQLMQQAIGALMGGGGGGGQPPVGAQGNQPYPTIPNPSGQYPGEPDAGAAGPMPGQRNMGAYLNAQRGQPSEGDIERLGSGAMPDEQYDKRFGEGAANAMGPYAGAEYDKRYSNDPREDQAIDYGGPTTYRGQQLQDRNEAESTRGMTTEQELEQAQQAMGSSKVIDRRGNAKTDEPTPEDIATLKEYPTDGNLANFDAKYGKGAAAFVISDGKENGSYSIDDPEPDPERGIYNARQRYD